MLHGLGINGGLKSTNQDLHGKLLSQLRHDDAVLQCIVHKSLCEVLFTCASALQSTAQSEQGILLLM